MFHSGKRVLLPRQEWTHSAIHPNVAYKSPPKKIFFFFFEDGGWNQCPVNQSTKMIGRSKQGFFQFEPTFEVLHLIIEFAVFFKNFLVLGGSMSKSLQMLT